MCILANWTFYFFNISSERFFQILPQIKKLVIFFFFYYHHWYKEHSCCIKHYVLDLKSKITQGLGPAYFEAQIWINPLWCPLWRARPNDPKAPYLTTFGFPSTKPEGQIFVNLVRNWFNYGIINDHLFNCI